MSLKALRLAYVFLDFSYTKDRVFRSHPPWYHKGTDVACRLECLLPWRRLIATQKSLWSSLRLQDEIGHACKQPLWTDSASSRVRSASLEPEIRSDNTLSTISLTQFVYQPRKITEMDSYKEITIKKSKPVSRRIFQPPPNNLNKPKSRRIIFRLTEMPPLKFSD